MEIFLSELSLKGCLVQKISELSFSAETSSRTYGIICTSIHCLQEIAIASQPDVNRSSYNLPLSFVAFMLPNYLPAIETERLQPKIVSQSPQALSGQVLSQRGAGPLCSSSPLLGFDNVLSRHSAAPGKQASKQQGSAAASSTHTHVG